MQTTGHISSLLAKEILHSLLAPNNALHHVSRNVLKGPRSGWQFRRRWCMIVYICYLFIFLHLFLPPKSGMITQCYFYILAYAFNCGIGWLYRVFLRAPRHLAEDPTRVGFWDTFCRTFFLPSSAFLQTSHVLRVTRPVHGWFSWVHFQPYMADLAI